MALASGTFTFLQAATLDHLAAARCEADILIVAVLEDGAPAVVPEGDRAIVIAAVRDVDHVVVTRSAAVPELLRRLRPDVYAPATTPDEATADAVAEYGGRILDSSDSESATLRLLERLRP